MVSGAAAGYQKVPWHARPMLGSNDPSTLSPWPTSSSPAARRRREASGLARGRSSNYVREARSCTVNKRLVELRADLVGMQDHKGTDLFRIEQ